jgi:short-subunit dehydrogenase
VLARRTNDAGHELRSKLGAALDATVIAADLILSGAVEQLHTGLHERGIRIHTLVNNAGYGLHGAFVDAHPTQPCPSVAVDGATEAFDP